jgi:hypothetical protein
MKDILCHFFLWQPGIAKKEKPLEKVDLSIFDRMPAIPREASLSSHRQPCQLRTQFLVIEWKAGAGTHSKRVG